MDLQAAIERIGDTAYVRSSKERWNVPCRILDVRVAYGRIDYLVDVDGTRHWISESRITFTGANEP